MPVAISTNDNAMRQLFKIFFISSPSLTKVYYMSNSCPTYMLLKSVKKRLVFGFSEKNTNFLKKGVDKREEI